MRFLILLALAVIGLVACPGPTFIVQQYSGPQRPRETIATLRVNGGDSVRLLYVDDEDVSAPIVSDGRLHIEILPGRHTVTARDGDDPRAPSASAAFHAEPGKVYRIVFEGPSARVFDVERDSDKPMRDVTLSEPPPVRPPPPAPITPITPDAGEEDARIDSL